MNKTENTNQRPASGQPRRNRPQRRPHNATGTPQGRPRHGGGAGRPQSGRPHANRNNKPGAKPAKRNNRNRRNQHRRRSNTSPALAHRLTTTDDKAPVIPEITDEDTVRIIPISGVEQIGRNMNIIETKDDIIVIDAGFQFVSAESNTPGIDYILPNTQYLEERKHKIRALVVTHGHLDHIGGIPFIIERIGNPPIYTQ